MTVFGLPITINDLESLISSALDGIQNTYLAMRRGAVFPS
jgi:hypothetical protein